MIANVDMDPQRCGWHGCGQWHCQCHPGIHLNTPIMLLHAGCEGVYRDNESSEVCCFGVMEDGEHHVSYWEGDVRCGVQAGACRVQVQVWV